MELLERCLAVSLEVRPFERGCVSMWHDGSDAGLELFGAVSDEQLASLQQRLTEVRVELRPYGNRPGVRLQVPGVTPAVAREFIGHAHAVHHVALTLNFLQPWAGHLDPLSVAEGLDAVRANPATFLEPVEARQVLVLAMNGTAVEVSARRASRVDVTFDGVVSISDDSHRYTLEPATDAPLTLTERHVEHLSYLRTVEGRSHDEAAVVNAVSKSFSIEVVRNDAVLQQTWRLGRRVGPAAPGPRRGRFATTLSFEPDPLLFPRPLQRDEVREVVELFAQRLPGATFSFDGATFHDDTLEAAARKVIGATPLWSEGLFVFSIDEPAFTLRVALGLSDTEHPPLHVLRNARGSNPFGIPVRGIRRALAAAVRLAERTEAPSRHLSGVIALETVNDVRESDELLDLIARRFVEPWSVYLDAVPQARERLAALWTASRQQ